jgi:hypothetical protein
LNDNNFSRVIEDKVIVANHKLQIEKLTDLTATNATITLNHQPLDKSGLLKSSALSINKKESTNTLSVDN